MHGGGEAGGESRQQRSAGCGRVVCVLGWVVCRRCVDCGEAEQATDGPNETNERTTHIPENRFDMAAGREETRMTAGGA